MDDTKIIKLTEFIDKKEESASQGQFSSSFLHTNPIIKEKLSAELHNKKNKFKFDDLLK